MRLWLLIGMLCTTTLAHAEVYRWVDENGQVHYSDRKLREDAEDVTAETRLHNLDTSLEERRKVARILRPPNNADRDYERRRYVKQQLTPEEQEYCKELRNIHRMLSGRIQWVDERGKEIAYTEKQREEDLKQAEMLLKDFCNN